MSWVSIVDGIEHKFHARGNAELFEYPKQIFLDRVFTEVELDGDLAIP